VALVPSQLPPQAVPSVAQAARLPRGFPVTVVQAPTLPATSQAWHWPLQAWLQQTPSVQWPLSHSLEAEQAAPSARFATHWPAEHQSPAAQSESAVQEVLQVVASQPYAPQAWVDGAGQEPLPHEAGSVSTPAEQDAPRHCADG
jgi:hypothetical protein